MWQFCTLSEEFIEALVDMVDWNLIAKHQTLSDQFILKWIDKLTWLNVSRWQVCSEEFLTQYFNKIYWFDFVRFNYNSVLSPQFIKRFWFKTLELIKDFELYQFIPEDLLEVCRDDLSNQKLTTLRHFTTRSTSQWLSEDFTNVVLPEEDVMAELPKFRENNLDFFKYNYYSFEFYDANWSKFLLQEKISLMETAEPDVCEKLYSKFGNEFQIDMIKSFNFSSEFVSKNQNKFIYSLSI